MVGRASSFFIKLVIHPIINVSLRYLALIYLPGEYGTVAGMSVPGCPAFSVIGKADVGYYGRVGPTHETTFPWFLGQFIRRYLINRAC